MIDEILTTTVVSIDQDRCLNNRHDRAGCSRCLDTCPTNAIVLDGNGPLILADECVRCGACATVCPTDAVDMSNAPERRLIDSCEQTPGNIVTLACSQHPQPRPAQSGSPLVRHARCLASLDIDHLITLTHSGTRRVHLDLSWCQDCPLVRAADTIVATADAAAALVALRARNPEPLITLDNLPALADPPAIAASGPIIDSWRPAMSRRGLFSSIRARLVAAAAPTATPPPVRRSHGPVAQRLPSHIPDSRRRLLERLDSIPAIGPQHTGADPHGQVVPAALVPVADIQVDTNKCSACALCAQYCPTGALSFTTKSGTLSVGTPFALTIQPSTCLSCDICAHACPEDALTFGATIDSTDLDHRRRVLVTGHLTACDTCGLPTAAGAGDTSDRCFSCRHGQGIVTALRDDAGLMADLLSRAPTAPA